MLDHKAVFGNPNASHYLTPNGCRLAVTPPSAAAITPWSAAYTIIPGQDDRGRWAFHVYHRRAGRLTTRGYERASMAERVAEMRHKLGLDEPDSASRRYLAHHFNDTLRTLEG